MADLRIIALVDVDSFECTIYQKMYPEWKKKPCVVADKSGRIVSVTYEAKILGVTRNDRVGDLRFLDPQELHIHIFWKNQKYNKPDSTKCRHASLEITDVVMKFCNQRNITVERVPIDEWFLDLTCYVNYLIGKYGMQSVPDFKNQAVYLESKHSSCTQDSLAQKLTWLANQFEDYTEEEKLAIGAGVVKKLFEVIFNETEFSCSAGVSFNKLLAKQACKLLPKPNTLTMLSSFGLKRVSKFIPLRDIWGLGGELGNYVETILPTVKTMADLKKIGEKHLTQLFGKEDAIYLYDTARGICYDEVIPKIIPDTVNCSKANLYITSYKSLRFHLDNLSKDMVNRLEEEQSRHQRYTNSLKIQFFYYRENDDEDSGESSVERTFDYDGEQYSWIAQTCFLEIREWGFHPYILYDDTVISGLKLTAKNFIM